MYRQYEDPRKLQEQLDNLKEEFQRRQSLGELDPYDYEDYSLEIHELEERINFAWQDEEYDEMHRDPADEQWMEENVYSAEEVDSHYFYRISIGSGGAWVDSYVIETNEPTTDYDALTDILLDYLRETEPDALLDPDTYMFDDNGDIFFIDDPDDIIYQDDFVEGGNYGDVLMHYGDFRIDEITEDEITENDIIVPEVW